MIWIAFDGSAPRYSGRDDAEVCKANFELANAQIQTLNGGQIGEPDNTGLCAASRTAGNRSMQLARGREVTVCMYAPDDHVMFTMSVLVDQNSMWSFKRK